jgi:hypothetical protein
MKTSTCADEKQIRAARAPVFSPKSGGWSRRFQSTHFLESSVFEPTFDFVKAERGAFFALDAHLNGKYQRGHWLGAVVVHQPFCNGAGAAFVMQNVA